MTPRGFPRWTSLGEPAERREGFVVRMSGSSERRRGQVLAPTQKIPLVSVVVEIPPKRRFARYQPSHTRRAGSIDPSANEDIPRTVGCKFDGIPENTDPSHRRFMRTFASLRPLAFYRSSVYARASGVWKITQGVSAFGCGARRLAATSSTSTLPHGTKSGSKLPHSRGHMRAEEFLPLALIHSTRPISRGEDARRRM
jgi:hypothetical protein